MGFFSKIAKSLKRVVRKALPIVARVAPFIPALAPFSPLIALGTAGVSRGGPTGREVAVPPKALLGLPTRFDRFRTTRAPARPGTPGISPAGGISVTENRAIDAAILLGQAAVSRGPIAGPSPVVLPQIRVPTPGSPIFAGGINVAGIGTLIRGVSGLFGGGAARVGAGALATGGAAGNLILSQTGKILAVVTATGARIGRKRAVAIAKSIGLNAAAAALGIGLVELATMVTEEVGRPRRRRGITARDFSTTRRTLTKIKTMHGMLPTRGTGRSRGPVHVRTAGVTHG